MTGYIGGILDCDVEEQLEPDYRAPASTPAIKHREVETQAYSQGCSCSRPDTIGVTLFSDL